MKKCKVCNAFTNGCYHENPELYRADMYGPNQAFTNKPINHMTDELQAAIIKENPNMQMVPKGGIALKNDQAKPDLSLIPLVALEAEAKAFQVGEAKYGRYNYCNGMEASRIVGALLRHALAYFNGEDFDPVDKQHHLGSVRACAAMLLRMEELGTLKDNRYKK